ncbi:MAG: M48 family metallopeptidase [Nitrospiraceae bacterium]|nr:M48 family metallopeptidase [Nitrospiraceae bacterium]
MNTYLIAILCLYIAKEAFEYLVQYLNLRHMQRAGADVPPEFEGAMDKGLLARTKEYEAEKTRFGFVSSVSGNIVAVVFIFGGLLDIYTSWVASLGLSFIVSGWLFFLLLFYMGELLGIPFSLYHTFRIENKYGFNTMTGGLWISDFLKSLVISSILLSLLAFAGLWLIKWSPRCWWFLVWGLLFLFSIILMYISPYVIEPLFNKFTPVEDEVLREQIAQMTEKAGIHARRILSIDASKRSRHSNAYFTGIGKTKRIVLYDTLLKSMSHDEILSVLAHEIGHWKKKHMLKMLAAFEAVSFAGLWVSHYLVQSDILTLVFGIGAKDSIFAKFVLLGFIAGIVSLPLKIVMNYFSRRNEKEADSVSARLAGNRQAMASALVKLSKENLSNLHPHPLYVRVYYSHPPIVQRIRDIRSQPD